MSPWWRLFWITCFGLINSIAYGFHHRMYTGVTFQGCFIFKVVIFHVWLRSNPGTGRFRVKKRNCWFGALCQQIWSDHCHLAGSCFLVLHPLHNISYGDVEHRRPAWILTACYMAWWLVSATTAGTDVLYCPCAIYARELARIQLITIKHWILKVVLTLWLLNYEWLSSCH